MAYVDDKEYGPFTWDQMRQMAAEGRVSPDLPVRKASDAEWSAAAAIPGLLGGTKPAVDRPAAAIAAGKSAVKLSKPLVRPPTGKPVPPIVAPPQNIPGRIPVGAPVGVTVGTPAPPPVALFNIDVGASPNGKMRSVKSVLDDDDQEKVGVKKQGSTVVIVGVLGGVTALVSVIVVLTIFITMNRGGNDETLAATNTSTPTKKAAPDEGEANSGEENPGGATRAEGAKKSHLDKKLAAAKATNVPLSQDANQKLAQAASKSIPERFWVVVATNARFGIGNAEITIGRTWLAHNEQGQRAASSPEAPAKYLFIEFVISNRAGSVLKYKSWNETNKNPVFLIDERDQLHQLIPASSTPDVARLPKTDIPGGKSLSEVLVFEAPPLSFEELRLLLPQNVFYERTKNPYFGIEITPDVLGNEGGPPVTVPLNGLAGDEANNPLGSRKVPTDPANPESLTPAETTNPASSKTAKKDEPSPKKPPSLFDKVNKFVEEDKRGKKMDEGKESVKGTEPAKKSEPVKTAEPAKGTEPAKPGEPAKTEEPENPFKPVKPKAPATPAPVKPPGKK